MDNGTKTIRVNKGFTSKFPNSQPAQQTPEEGWRVRCWGNKNNDDNISPNVNNNNI